MSANFRCVKQQSASGSWPWALGCLNLKFTVQSTLGDGAVEILDALHNEAIS